MGTRVESPERALIEFADGRAEQPQMSVKTAASGTAGKSARTGAQGRTKKALGANTRIRGAMSILAWFVRRLGRPSQDGAMTTVVSPDGTRIAYTRRGRGPALVLVDGALCH